MNLEDLPPEIRVKLREKDQRHLWEEIGNRGGIKQFSKSSDFSASKLYNWKNKDSFLPINLVTELLGNPEITHLKGGSNSKATKTTFPIEINDELATRTTASVSVNREGTPVYITNELPLMKRFETLLQQIGEVPTTRYHREQHELRFPGYIYQIIVKSSAEKDLFSALFDERGKFKANRMIVEDREKGIQSFQDKLYSRQKKMELALKTENQELVEEILGDTSQMTEIFSREI